MRNRVVKIIVPIGLKLEGNKQAVVKKAVQDFVNCIQLPKDRVSERFL